MNIDLSRMPDECPLCEGTGKATADFATRVVWLRKRSGKTQEEIAAECKLSRTTWVNIETNRQGVTTDALIAISKAFGVSTDWLLGLDNKEHTNG